MEWFTQANLVVVVVSTVAWVAVGAAIAVNVRRGGRVLGVIACAVPLLGLGVQQLLVVATSTMLALFGYGWVVVIQIVAALGALIHMIVLAAAVIVASRVRVEPSGGRR